MTTYKIAQNSFASGEWTPSMWGRTDMNGYASASRLLKNWFIHRTGKASTRPGTIFLTNPYGGKYCVFIPFEFSITQAYLLELTDGILRVYKDDGLVLIDATNTSIYKWTASGSGTNEYYMELLAGGDPSILEPQENEVYFDGVLVSEGALGSLAAGTYGYGDNDTLGYDTLYVRLADGADPDSKGSEFVQVVGQYAIPYAEADLADLKFTQSADTLYINHPSYAPRTITRTSHYSWVVSTTSFVPSLSGPGTVNAAQTPAVGSTTRTVYYTVTAVTPEGDESPVGAIANCLVDSPWAAGNYVSITWTSVTGAAYYNIYKSSRGSDAYGLIGTMGAGATMIDDNIEPDYTQGPPVIDYYVFTATDDYPGSVAIFEQRMCFARSNNSPQTVWASQTGLFKNFSVSRPLTDSDAIDVTLASLKANEIRHLLPLQKLFVFTSGGEWTLDSGSNSDALTPTSIKFTSQSYYGSDVIPPLAVGNTVLFIQRGGNVIRDLAYSLEIDGYSGTNLSILADHLFVGRRVVSWAYQQTPESIVWVVMDDGALLGFTYLREHQMWAWHRHETDGYFEWVTSLQTDTADSIYLSVRRTINGTTKRFVEKLSTRLPNRDITWHIGMDCALTYDGWNSNSSYLMTLTGGSTWGVGETGLTLTASGGHTPFTSGSVGDILIMRDTDGFVYGTTQELRLEVTAYTSSTVVTVKLLTDCPEDLQGTATDQWANTSMTFSNLDHLEGEEVSIFADGDYVSGQTVTSGAVSIPFEAAVVHVGLPYTCDLQTMALEVPGPDGTMQGRRKRLPGVILRLEDSRGGFIGTSFDNLTEMKDKQAEDYYERVPVFTGDRKESLRSKFEREAVLCIRQSTPNPLSVLSYVAEVEMGDVDGN